MSIENTLLNYIDNDTLSDFKKKAHLETLTTATMIPLAIIMSKELFNLVKLPSQQKKSKTNGDFLKKCKLLPFALKPETLIPAGILLSMLISYNNILKIQKGGSPYSNLETFTFKKLTKPQVTQTLKFFDLPKQLNSSTLLPICMLFGDKVYEKYIIDDIKKHNNINTMGDTPILKKYPFLKDELLQEYLESNNFEGNIRMNTLVPLGLLFMLYNIYS